MQVFYPKQHFSISQRLNQHDALTQPSETYNLIRNLRPSLALTKPSWLLAFHDKATNEYEKCQSRHANCPENLLASRNEHKKQ